MTDFRSLFRSWFAHLIERLVRLHSYVSERAAEAPKDNRDIPHVISALLVEIGRLGESVRSKARSLEGDNNVDVNRAAYYVAVRSLSERFRRLHEQLTFLPAPWPRLELGLFVDRILDETPQGRRAKAFANGRPPLTILLSGTYNFSHILVHPANRNMSVRVPTLQSILTIPAAEKDNPLIWPNLIHEMAHWIGKEAGIVDAAKRLDFVQSRVAHTRTIVEQWVREMVADLLALDFMGISYFGSFMTFASYWIPYSLRQHSELHPSAEARMKYLLSRFEKRDESMKRELMVQWESEYNGRLVLDHEDSEARQRLFDQYDEQERIFPDLPDTNELVELAELIVRLSEYKEVSPPGMTEVDAQRIKDLGRRLERGELIASRREHKIHKPTWKLDDIRAHMKEARDQLAETPNTVTDILAAAMLRKLSYAYTNSGAPPIAYRQRLLSLFCASPQLNASEMLVDMRAEIGAFDAIISKSIEGTGVLQFFHP